MAYLIDKPLPKSKRYRAGYTNWKGKPVKFTGTTNKAETLAMARRLEDEHRQVRLGYRPPPKLSEQHAKRPFEEVCKEYVAWGSSCGGVDGRPWAPEHAEKRTADLVRWGARLRLSLLADLTPAILPRVESEIRRMQGEGRANLTIRHRVDSLSAFCEWCVDRDYLDGDPLKKLVPVPKKAKYERRALTQDEVQRLLTCCRPRQRLIYEVALTTGLRANALRNIRARHLDMARGGINIAAAWAKNRKDGFQPLAKHILDRLAEVARQGGPDTPLLDVGMHTARDLDVDLKRAAIPKWLDGKKVDFHALRVAYASFVLEVGANPKELQSLGQWHSAELPMQLYAKARNDRLAELAEAVGSVIGGEKRATTLFRQQPSRTGKATSTTDQKNSNLCQNKQENDENPMHSRQVSS